MLSIAEGSRRGVVAATLVFLGLQLGWAVITPVFRGADEPAHLSGISRVARDHDWEPPETARLDPAVRAAYPTVSFVDPPWLLNPPLGEVGPGQGPNAPGLEQLRAQGSSAPPLSDPASVHPPAYYVVGAIPYSVFGLDHATPSGAVLVLRLLSGLLLVGVPLWCAATATELGLGSRAATAAAFLPATLIQFIHAGSALNNGTLVIACSALVTALLVPVMTRGETSYRRAAVVGAVTSVGLLTKAFAFGIPLMVIIAYLVAQRRQAHHSLKALGIATACGVPGGLWWLVQFSTLENLVPVAAGDGTTPETSVLGYVTRAVLDVSSSLWVNLGWLNTPLPMPLHLATTGIALLAIGFGTYRLRGQRGALAVLHVTWLVPLVMITVWSIAFYRRNGLVDGMQGRYLFGSVVAFVVLGVSAVRHWPTLLSCLPALSTALGTAGLVFGLRSFWSPPSPWMVAQWWPGGSIVLGAAAACLVAGLALQLVHARRE